MRPAFRTGAALAATLLIAGCGSSNSSKTNTSNAVTTMSTPTTATAGAQGATLGYEGIALELGQALGPASSTTPGTPVDDVKCLSAEQLAYHIHAHLAVYAGGQPLALPAGVGITQAQVQQTKFGLVVGAGKCFYFLHTHTTDGVIHIESPVSRIYTLGNFFDEWRQPLTSTRVASVSGKVTAFLNGKLWKGSPRNIQLGDHSVIQLDVGTAQPAFQAISWAGTQLG